jgi:hypothetical protein
MPSSGKLGCATLVSADVLKECINPTIFLILTDVKFSKSYITLTKLSLWRRRSTSPVKYELGFIFQKMKFFMFTAVEPSNLACQDMFRVMMSLLSLCSEWDILFFFRLSVHKFLVTLFLKFYINFYLTRYAPDILLSYMCAVYLTASAV